MRHWYGPGTRTPGADQADPGTGPYPRIAAGMALVVFGTVLQQWQPGDDEQRLAELTDQAFAVVAPALDAPAG